MTVVDLWVNALTGKAAAAFMGQAGNEGMPELLGGDLSASSTLQHLLVSMDKSGVDVGVIAAGIAAEETGPLLNEVAAHPDRLRVALTSDGPTGPSNRSGGSVPWPSTRPSRWCGSRRSSTSTRSTTSSTTLHRLRRAGPAGVDRRGIPRCPRALGLQHPLLEEVLIDFRELTVIGDRMGHPYVALLMAYMLKWPDLYLSNSAYLARYMDPALVSFMDSSPRHGPGPLRVGPPFSPDGAGGGCRPGPAALGCRGRSVSGRHGNPPPRPRLNPDHGFVLLSPTEAPGTVPRKGLGRVGVWWSGTSRDPDDPGRSVAPELEALGYGALWSSGRFDPGLSPHFEKLLAATEPRAGRQRHRQHLGRRAGRRGAGRGHARGALLGALPARARRQPRRGRGRLHTAVFEDGGLPRCPRRPGPPVPPERRVLAALGPRMLEFAAARSAGAHPYFVPVEHTARARDILGPDPYWRPRWRSSSRRTRPGPGNWPGATPAPTSTCPTTRRTCAPSASARTTSSGGGSDRLIDAVIPWGDPEAIAAAVAGPPPGRCRPRVRAGRRRPRRPAPLDGYRGLATTLFG